MVKTLKVSNTIGGRECLRSETVSIHSGNDSVSDTESEEASVGKWECGFFFFWVEGKNVQ